MKKNLLAGLMVLTLCAMAQAEVIYTKDGSQIQAKIDEVTADSIWYEATTGEVTEYLAIDRKDVVKILKDDGTEYRVTE